MSGIILGKWKKEEKNRTRTNFIIRWTLSQNFVSLWQMMEFIKMFWFLYRKKRFLVGFKSRKIFFATNLTVITQQMFAWVQRFLLIHVCVCWGLSGLFYFVGLTYTVNISLKPNELSRIFKGSVYILKLFKNDVKMFIRQSEISTNMYKLN